ncbi:MAG: hypothetical protein ABSF77_02710 [Spirochaetia bacterium]
METVELPKPRFGRGRTTQSVFLKRRTVREIGNKKLSLQMLSNLLWSACGVNRKQVPFGLPGIAAASASNSQEIDLYVALESGVYFSERADHRLALVAGGIFACSRSDRLRGRLGQRLPYA